MIALLALALAVQAVPAEQRYLRVSFEPRNWDDTLIRPARPVEPIDRWFAIDGSTFRAMGLLPADKTIYASGTVAVDAEGKVGECKVGSTDAMFNPALTVAICADLSKKGRFIPTLDAEGRRIPALLSIFGKSTGKDGLWGDGGETPPLVDDMPPPPAPPAPPAPPNTWTASYVANHFRVTGVQPYNGDLKSLTPGILRFTGVSLSLDPAGKTACAIARSSGDPQLDQKACKAARKFKVAAVDPGSRFRRGAMIMMMSDRGKPTAVMPVRTQSIEARLTPAGSARIAAILGKSMDDKKLAERIDASIGADGIASRCRIVVSDGRDAVDVELCRALKTESLFAPAEDVFGLPTTDWL